MVYLQNSKRRLFVTSFATLLGLAFFFDAIGSTNARGAEVGCLPPTPGPCAADGICRPNQASFGYSPTRWRQWPGDPKAEEPTPADEEAVEEEEMVLEPFEHPAPEEEDTRGPAKAKSFSPAEESPSPAISEEVPFPELDQQGSIPVEIRTDDAPPELPRRLRRLASASRLGHLSMAPTSRSSHSERINRNNNRSFQSSNSQARQRLPKQTERGSAIVRATAEQRARRNPERPARLGLAKSASATPAETEIERRNQQAIYYQTVNRAK